MSILKLNSLLLFTEYVRMYMCVRANICMCVKGISMPTMLCSEYLMWLTNCPQTFEHTFSLKVCFAYKKDLYILSDFVSFSEIWGVYSLEPIYNDASGSAVCPLWLSSWSREAFAQSTPGVTFIFPDILEYINTNTKSKHSKINDHCQGI